MRVEANGRNKKRRGEVVRFKREYREWNAGLTLYRRQFNTVVDHINVSVVHLSDGRRYNIPHV
jgi:hypothetical protein